MPVRGLRPVRSVAPVCGSAAARGPGGACSDGRQCVAGVRDPLDIEHGGSFRRLPCCSRTATVPPVSPRRSEGSTALLGQQGGELVARREAQCSRPRAPSPPPDASAPPAARRSRRGGPATPANRAERTRPNDGTRTKPVSSVPAMPPAGSARAATTSRPMLVRAHDQTGGGGEGRAQDVRGTSRTTAAATKRAGPRLLASVARIATSPRRPARRAARDTSRAMMAVALPAAARPAGSRHSPGIVTGPTEAGEQDAAEGEAREVRGEHYGERVASSAQELDQQLGPHDLVERGRPHRPPRTGRGRSEGVGGTAGESTAGAGRDRRVWPRTRRSKN